MAGGKTHSAVVAVGLHQPLQIAQFETLAPGPNEIKVHVKWTASTPFDKHQSDGGLFANFPIRMGDAVGGTVVELGPGAEKRFKLGDTVNGIGYSGPASKAHQDYAILPISVVAPIPPNLTLLEAITIPGNFFTMFHGIHNHLGPDIELPWPIPEKYTPKFADSPILIWGGAASTGQFGIQILHRYGYRNIITVASKKHHAHLKELGAVATFDYHDAGVLDQVLAHAAKTAKSTPIIPYIFDCIGAADGSLDEVAKIAEPGAYVAVVMPVILKQSSGEEPAEITFEIEKGANFKAGVHTEQVKMFEYVKNSQHKELAWTEITYTFMKEGWVKPNAQRVLEGTSMLDRAQKAMEILRGRDISSEKICWRVSDVETELS